MTLADRLNRHPRRYFWLFTAWFAAGQCCFNLSRSLTFDEMVNLALSRLPSIGALWGYIVQGIELNPPLPFWLQWGVARTLGEGEVLSRVPAMLGFWLMCVCLYHFVRRRSEAAYGFAALLFPVFTYTSADATFARGYGPMLGFMSVALLAWQVAGDARGARRRLAVVALAAGVALAVSCHFYAAYIAGAIGLGELVRTLSRRNVDAPIWAALAAGLAPLYWYLPMIRRATGASATFWVPARISYIRDTYWELLGATVVVLLVWAWYTAAQPTSEPAGRRPLTPWPRHEAVACLVLLLMPVLVGLAAQVAPLAFYTRYVQPVVMGAAAVLALFAYQVTGHSVRLRGATLAAVVWVGFVPWGVFQMYKAAAIGSIRAAAVGRFAGVLAAKEATRLPLVIDSDGHFLRLLYYGSAAQKRNVFALSDNQGPVRFLGADTSMRSLQVLSSFQPVPLVNYRQFLKEHSEFLVAYTEEASWVIQQLRADGVRMELERFDKEPGSFSFPTIVFHAYSHAK
jgi:hypothetical protein